MADNKVKPEMIDDELVNKISKRTGVFEIPIRYVLTYLANNPIAPTRKEVLEIANSTISPDAHIGVPSREVQCYLEFQCRVYLKRKPELPEEVKKLLWKANPFANKGAEYRHDEAVRQAYELGKKASK